MGRCWQGGGLPITGFQHHTSGLALMRPLAVARALHVLCSGELGFFIFKNKFLVLVFGGKKLATLQVGNPSGISQVKPPLRGRDLWTPSLPLHRTATQEVLVPCSSEHPKHSAHALWNIVLLWRMEQINFLWRAGPEPKGFKWQQGRFGWIKGRKNHSTVDGLPQKVSPPGLEVLKLMLMASQLSGCCVGRAGTEWPSRSSPLTCQSSFWLWRRCK